MAHTTQNKAELLVRIRRIAGQVAAIEKALTEEDDCSKILQLIAGSRGAMDGLMAEVLEGHVRLHVANPKATDRAQATEDLIKLIRSYLK